MRNMLNYGNALEFYSSWDSPVVIISDGPYGISGYDGDLKSESNLSSWYEPHIIEWAKISTALTTLWFWNTEVGWAEVHPVLKKHGWIYRSCNIWDKGIAHIAGNCNTKTMRKFPVVTEVCAHYIRKPEFFVGKDVALSAQDWLRKEWKRAGLTLNQANIACGVKNAASRKYLTHDHLWYFPPAEMFECLSRYANTHGNQEYTPYFSLNGDIISGSQWERLRAKFYCPVGKTNVWYIPSVKGAERLKIDGKIAHPNQKPKTINDMLISCSSDVDDVVWEPFGGTCSASLSAKNLGRKFHASEINLETYLLAKSILE
mgnify:CR=1 FL=1